MNIESICNRVLDESGWKEITAVHYYNDCILMMGYSATLGVQMAKVTKTDDGLGFNVEYFDGDRYGLGEKWKDEVGR